MNIFIRISLKRIRLQKAYTLMTVAGICLGVAAVVSIAIVNKSVMHSFEESINQVAGKAALQITNAASGFPEEIMERVLKVPGVEYAVPIIETQGILHGGKEQTLMILGVDALQDNHMRDYSFADESADIPDPLLFLARPDSILLTRSLAEREGITIDQKIRVETVDGIKIFRVRGLLNPEGPARAMGGNLAVMDIFAAQKAFGKEGRIDRIDITVTRDSDLETVRNGIRKAIPEGYGIETSTGRTKQIGMLLSNFQKNINLISYLTVFVGMYLIYNAVSISVVQRRKQIGILRALGATRAQIIKLILGEIFILAVLSAGIGIGLGILFAKSVIGGVGQIVAEVFLRTSITEISVSWTHIAMGFVTSIAASLTAAVFPALAGTRITPISALRLAPYSGDGFFSRKNIHFAALSCLVLSTIILLIYKIGGTIPLIRNTTIIFLSVLFLLLGISLATPFFLRFFITLFHKGISPYVGSAGRLAGLNLGKNIMRNSVAVAAIFYGIALFVGSADLIKSVKTSVLDYLDSAVRADILVTSGHPLATSGSQNIPMPAEMEKKIENISGVLSADPLRRLYIDYKGRRILLLALDVTRRMSYSHFIIAKGDLNDMPRLLPRQDNIVVNEGFAAQYGIKPGDTVTLPTPAGPVVFGVAAVIVDYNSDSGSLLMDIHTYQRRWKDTLVDTFSVRIRPNEDVAAVKEAIGRQFRNERKMYVLSAQEFRNEIRKVLDQTFILSHAIITITITIACLGIIITMLASVLERTREIGILRSIGMLKSQVSAVVVLESSLLGLVGGVLGVSAGILIGWMGVEGFYRTDFGASIQHHISFTSLGWAIILSVMLSAAAGIYPAYRTAKINIVEALSYE